MTSLAIGIGLVLYSLFHARSARQSNSQNDLELEQFHQQRAEQSALGLKESRKILAVTRVHKGSSASHMSSKENVLEFVKNSMAYASSVLICVRETLLLFHSSNSSTLALIRTPTHTHFLSFQSQLGNSNTSELNTYMSEVNALLHKEGLDSRTTLVSVSHHSSTISTHARARRLYPT